MVSGQKATVVTLVNMFGVFKRGHSNSGQRWSKWKWSKCVRSDHRDRSRSVNNVSKVVRVLKWSKVVNGQKWSKVVNSGQWSESYSGHCGQSSTWYYCSKRVSVTVVKSDHSGRSGSGQCVSKWSN